MTTTNGQSKDKKPMKNEKATANGNNKEPKKKNKNKTMNQGSKKSMNDTQNGNNNNKKKKQEQAKPKNAPDRTSPVPAATATATNKTPTTMNNNDNSNNNVVNKEQHAPPPPQRRNMTTRYISSKPFTLVTGRGPIPNIVLSSGGNMDDSHVDALTQWMDQSEKIKKLVINNKGENSSSSSSGGSDGPLPLRCNIEMQENQFSDAGIEKLVNFLLNRTHLIQVNALKLWKNKIGDVGAQHLSRLIRELPYALVELHLSHNRITTQGALSILKAIESSDLYPRCKSSKSSKLSTKKCQATDNSEESEESSIDDIVEENANSGTVVDDNTNDNQTQTVHIEEDPLNTSNDSDSTSSSSGNIDVTIPESPPTKETNNSYVPLWLRLEFNFINLELLEKEYDYKSALCPCDASNRNLCGPNSCSLVHKSNQDNKKCKVHLYVFHLQYQKPEESTLLTDAKNTIQKIKQRSASSPSDGEEQVNEKDQISPEITADEMFVSHLPTYIFIDTCAILNMIDGPKFVHPAEHRFCQNFNFKSLISKAMVG